jgi:hypothetical protein
MVLLAMLLFGLMAMAALVIDLGFARLAQRQMQTAADAAALEGLRGEGLAFSSYSDRQEVARNFIAWTFDDNLNVTQGDNGLADGGASFGAGPMVTFSGAAGDPQIHASELLTVDLTNRVYKPAIMLGEESPGQFRVELQRGTTNDQANLYSQGPAVPFLFARGSLIDRSLVERGMAVGAISTAQARPAVRVGAPVGTFLGVVAVAYALGDWGPAPMNPVEIASDISSGLSIGESILIGGAVSSAADGYCAIYDPATLRVIGFGLLGQPVPPAGVVAERNASAYLIAAKQSLGRLTEEQRNDVLFANATLQHALKAPVLVRN